MTYFKYRYKVSKNLPWNDDFGQQNTTEGHAKMNYALENGVNFLYWRCILFQRIKIPQAFERIIGLGLKSGRLFGK
jgi:hypothetical protein